MKERFIIRGMEHSDTYYVSMVRMVRLALKFSARRGGSAGFYWLPDVSKAFRFRSRQAAFDFLEKEKLTSLDWVFFIDPIFVR